MLLGIDHLVIAVVDPDAAAAELERRLGLRAGGGGIHPTLGTHNRLVWLGDAYLELIGVLDEARAADSWIGEPVVRLLAERGGGLATWAVAVDDLAGHLDGLRARGGRPEGPVPGERRRPDGRVVRWTIGRSGQLGPALPPFLIEHDASGAEWTPAERAARSAEAHPVGASVRLSGLHLSVVDPGRLASRSRDELALPFEASEAGPRARIGPHEVMLHPAAGDGGGDGGRPRIELALAGGGSGASPDPVSADLFGCRIILAPAGEEAKRQ